jgi:hypothetical protein
MTSLATQKQTEPIVERWLTRALALGVIALAIALVAKSMPTRAPIVETSRDASTDAALSATTSDAGAVALTEAGPLLVADLAAFDDILSDASTGPLPSTAPRQIHMGVVLLTFAGAQGAPSSARSKADAHDLATRLAGDAKTDFHSAVQRGDSGSADDVGRIPRGTLEPQTEYAVFTLPAGGVSDVIETPRGFWIVKRID